MGHHLVLYIQKIHVCYVYIYIYIYINRNHTEHVTQFKEKERIWGFNLQYHHRWELNIKNYPVTSTKSALNGETNLLLPPTYPWYLHSIQLSYQLPTLNHNTLNVIQTSCSIIATTSGCDAARENLDQAVPSERDPQGQRQNKQNYGTDPTKSCKP